MTRWRKPDTLTDGPDRKPARERVVGMLNGHEQSGYTLSDDYQASEEMAVFVSRRFEYTEAELRRLGSWHCPRFLRVARTYGRKVAWFKSDDDAQRSGELVYVGDAGFGYNWRTRMVTLFREAVASWEAHRKAHTSWRV